MRAVGRPLALGRPNVARSRRVKLSRLRRWLGALAPLSRPGLVVAMLGGELRKQFDEGAATAWAADPYARGAISYCVPGRSGARALLAQPVGGRLVFAGEHTSQRWQGYMNGAVESGLRAVEELHLLEV